MLEACLELRAAFEATAGDIGGRVQRGGGAVLPQERKSSLQTRTLWLLAEHGDFEGLSD